MFNSKISRACALALITIITTSFSGCSQKSKLEANPVVPSLPIGPELNGSLVPKKTMKLVSGPLHSNLNILNNGSEKDAFYLEVEGALSVDSFSRLKSSGGVAAVANVLAESLARLKKIGVIAIDQSAEVGYFTFWLPYDPEFFHSLKTVSLPAEVYFNPMSYDLDSLSHMKSYRADTEGFLPRSSSAGFSGLSLMHAPEFVSLAETEIKNSHVDGSSVKLGITDTGITYRHPTFLDSSKTKSRVTYMKDFTREGRAYFNPAAKFVAVQSAQDPNLFLIQADYLVTKALPELPNPNDLKSTKDLKIEVSDELKGLLLDPKKKVVLGYLNESSLQGADEAVDLNGNGTLNDQIPLLLVTDLDSGAFKIYADFSVKNNFRTSPGLSDFNQNGETVKVFAESIGFHLQKDALPVPGTEDVVKLVSASIMGYDPGNHGTHVAGIAAGRKTISNDPDDTLARGVAPAASILMNRVCANNGGCNATKAIIDMAVNGKAELINMSLGGLSPFNDGYGVQETVVNRLTSVNNVLFLISAGNSGPGRQTVGSPSVARLSLSVGAAASRSLIERQYQWPGTGALSTSADPASDEFMLFFSSRGPTAAGGFKPNISAPGTELSSVQMNSAPGIRAGLDVYWGTSMAAPAASGAYALFLDAIKKYNLEHASAPLPTRATTLRQVLIASARPFSKDQFTWMDEGTGMVDLVSAWSLLKALQSETLSSGVTDETGKEVKLDYEVLTSFKNPTDGAFDGSRVVTDDAGNKLPAFGSGVYLSAKDTSNFFPVYLSRRLTEADLASPVAGDLTVKLVTSAEEFVLKTDFGQDAPWLKAGVRDEMNCMSSDTANLRVIGRGAEIKRHEDGTGEINAFGAATLNLCVDRAKLGAMSPGDHGALVYAYRTDGTHTSSVPAFIVPVSITIPHQSLANSTAYEVSGSVKSFQVARNCVVIPKGAKMVRVTLEVPEIKANENCSGVELMELEGGNTLKPAETRAQMRIINCNPDGSPVTDAKKRTLVLNRSNPVGGIWDLHVFGSYRFKESSFKLRVDYLMAETSLSEIKGDVSKLSGKFSWSLSEASVQTTVDLNESSYALTGLSHREQAMVKKDEQVLVAGPLGVFHSYPAQAKKVRIETGGSPGNDIDLDVLECQKADPSACKVIGQSGGSTDIEKVEIAPKSGKFYVIRVAGYEVKDDGKFFEDESIEMGEEKGSLQFSAVGDHQVDVDFGFTPEQIKQSTLLQHALFTSKAFQVTGAVTLRSKEKVTLGAIPVQIGL